MIIASASDQLSVKADELMDTNEAQEEAFSSVLEAFTLVNEDGVYVCVCITATCVIRFQPMIYIAHFLLEYICC
jgi:hypothetical protein